MNFLKRAGAIFMLIAIFASSCNKYADDFKQVNTKLDALATQISGVASLSTDITALKAQVTALQTAIAGMPSTASITVLSTVLTATTVKIDAIAATLNTVVASGTANATAIAGVKADLAALVTSQAAINAAATAAFAAEAVKLTALDTKVSGIVAQITAIGLQETALAAAIATNNSAIAANAASLVTLAAQQTALAAQLTALAATTSSADAIAVATAATNAAAAATANADLAAKAADILSKLAANTSADEATALVIDALTVSLADQKLTLDQLVANTVKTVTGVTISGTPQIGVELSTTVTGSVGAVPLANTSYVWESSATSGGTYAAIAGASTTSGKYTISAPDDLGKFIKVIVTGTGTYAGTATSAATTVVVAQTAVTAVTLVGGSSAQVGVELTTTLTPAAATVTYLWESAATISGAYTAIPDASTSTGKYTPVPLDATRFIKVTATGSLGYTGSVTSGFSAAVLPATITAVTSANFGFVTGNNTLRITLIGGTFKAGTIAASDFTFSGTDAAAIASSTSTFTRTSDNVVTVTGIVPGIGNLNTVTVKAATMATQATSVTAVNDVSVVLPNTTPVAFTFGASDNMVTITLTGGGTFKTGTIVAGDFIITGPDASFITGATFTRVSSSKVTITGIPVGSTSENIIAVKYATMAIPTLTSTVVSSIGMVDISSAFFTMNGTDNAIRITLAGGRFRTSGSTVSASDFTFTGTDAAALAAGTFKLTVDGAGVGVVTVTGLASGLVGVNNKVIVKGTAQLTQSGTPLVALLTINNVTTPVSPLTTGDNTVTITLVGGANFRIANSNFGGKITAADFTFTGVNASVLAGLADEAFVRTNATTVTITVPELVSTGNITVTVKASVVNSTPASVTVAGSVV